MMKTGTRLFTYLDGSGHTGEEVGGKAAGLDRLIGAGFPVPTATVLTTETYRQTTSEHSLELLVADLRTSALPTPDRISAEQAAIERAFLTAPLPETVRSVLGRVGREMLAHGPVAVRSSATAEDLQCASFAGQYLTVTQVADNVSLERAVRRCWASLWFPAARAYRRSRKVSEHRIAMAVIVQAMVEPLWSGVAFTTDPEGASHLIRVEAVRGLGEALVSGKVTPDDYTIRKDTLEVFPGPGSDELDFLEDLGRIAIDLETTERRPQDIEWAYTESGLTLLQLRPVSAGVFPRKSVVGLDTTAGQEATYTPHGVIEMLPGVVPPLLWTINAPMLENAFRTTLSDLGGETPDRTERIVCRFRGRTALNLSALSEIAGSMPGGSAAEVERQYLGHPLSKEVETPRVGSQVLPALRARRVHRRIVDEVNLISAAAQGLNEIGLDLSVLPVRRLVAYRQRIRDLAWRGYTAEVGASSAAAASYRALEVLLALWLPEAEATLWAQRTTSGALAQSAVGSARAKALRDVIDRHASTAVKKIIAAGGAKQQVADVGRDGHEFVTALDRTVTAMGSRAIYGDVTWAEDDRWIWRQMQLSMTHSTPRHDETGDEFAALCTLLSSRKGWRRFRILTGQFVDVRLRWLRRQIKETIRFLELRERAKTALLVLGGEERRIIVESATRLVESRLLPHLDQVQFLTDAELDGMLFGRRGSPADVDWRERQRLALEQSGKGPLPSWFRGDPDRTELPPDRYGDRLEGWAASPGQAEGVVRIINSLEEGTRLQRGDVLVAHATDPSWTPLLLTAGAIVLETGGPLAHAAIVARELGLPAVLNVPAVSRVLNEGERVRVDGTSGVVDRIANGAST